MKAWTVEAWGTPRDMKLADVPVPEPGPKQALVRVHAAALNFFDVLMIAGKYQVKPPLPFSPGCEMAGEVVKAVVVLRENSDNHEPNEALRCLRSFCASHLADYKRPALYEAIALSELPMTGSGKIAKAELRKGDASRRCPTVAAPADNIVLSEGRCGVGGYAQPLLTIEWQKRKGKPKYQNCNEKNNYQD